MIIRIGLKEDKKIGYSALIVGTISQWEAWKNILGGQTNFAEIFFLSLGLIASLFGIALILQKSKSTAEK